MSKISAYTAKTPDAHGHIDYTPAENAVWRDLVARQLPGTQKYCAAPYLEGLRRLGLPADRVAQCDEVSQTLAAFTGWRVEPVPALIPFGRFFDMLATRRFPAASFIRSRKDFDYIKEPDIFHEIFGHAPLLTDPRFAGFSQAIGRAGQGARPTDYAWLIRLYWFTIEFGLTREAGQIKALGSGLASSPTELPYSVGASDKTPHYRAFDVLDILRTPYRIDIHQPVYFVLENLDDLFAAAERDLLADVLEAQSRGLFEPMFDPTIGSVEEPARKAS